MYGQERNGSHPSPDQKQNAGSPPLKVPAMASPRQKRPATVGTRPSSSSLLARSACDRTGLVCVCVVCVMCVWCVCVCDVCVCVLCVCGCVCVMCVCVCVVVCVCVIFFFLHAFSAMLQRSVPAINDIVSLVPSVRKLSAWKLQKEK